LAAVTDTQADIRVPFFRPSITHDEVRETLACLRSGWLTTGPRTKRFEEEFAAVVGARHAVALNSCTAALHLAVESLELGANQAVLVPTMTFAATAEVVRYLGAVPLLVDCDPITLNMDLADAQRKLDDLRASRTSLDPELEVVGMIVVHVGGLMMDLQAVHDFAARHRLWVVEDAAHAFPAAWRPGPDGAWQRCGENSAAVTCFSFYANKTITTGEGGMAVTDDACLAERIRQMSLHGLSHDAWGRYAGSGPWDYRIVAPGYKYNMTDLAAALGICQLRRAESLRCQREELASRYLHELGDLEQLELPHSSPPDRIHAWHLFPIRLTGRPSRADRNAFFDILRSRGVGCSVHWRPLHLHPYYEQTFSWKPDQFPVATAEWERLISLPLFPGMSQPEHHHVVSTVRQICQSFD
jgi:perosamine synthetase